MCKTARHLPSIPFTQPTAAALLGPPTTPRQVDNRVRAHQMEWAWVGGRSGDAGMSWGESAGLHGWRRPLCAHMDAPGAVSASSEATPASRSAITHHKASAPGSACGVRACEHALLAWLLKDTGMPAWGGWGAHWLGDTNANGGKIKMSQLIAVKTFHCAVSASQISLLRP